MRLRLKLKKALHDLLSLEDTPHRIALGFALGVFVAFSPLMGLHIVSALAIAATLRINSLVVLTGTLVNNPWTIALIYGGSLYLGRWILQEGGPIMAVSLQEDLLVQGLWDVAKSNLLPLLVGTSLLGFGTAILSYLILFLLVRSYSVRRALKRYPDGALAPSINQDRLGSV
ncbi:MAG: DUF2062 domain-containing protein [Candidatus Tectomicrobia bacterium]|uniref:DUF2062 domain-containing protein n=1 Tax=Tectimicrobiota bacterium TaxID=2528274 RepID=A0A932CPA4_UNCTE|nr:DUF2062 domain-containing protein [Candidatus Tectomicrobia bacterium]